MSFENLNLHPDILKALTKAGYQTPTPIQEQAIPLVLAGNDLRASAQTGTGKTAAFLLPAIQKLLTPAKIKAMGPRILVLVPTRELAMQVAKEATKYSAFMSKIKTVCIYGGAPYPVQNRELSRHYEILVATPGRLIDHMERGRIDFSRLELLILDEADRMLDMGFIGPVEQIAAATPKTRQTVLFSATLKGAVLELSKRLLNKPVEVSVTPEKTKHENIEQQLHYCDSLGHKHRLLSHVLAELENQTIVFTSTKRNADELVDVLIEQGHHAAALHGDMNQRQRTRTITRLRQGDIKVLVATDVAARGIDINTISTVINFDLPMNAEDYVHRIGRTGRAGAKGIALSFATYRDARIVKQIEQFTGHKLATHVIKGFEPSSKPEANKPFKSAPRGPFRKGKGKDNAARPPLRSQRQKAGRFGGK